MESPTPHVPMVDGAVRRSLKACMRWLFSFELRARRLFLRALRRDYYRLAGACHGCAKCCERPTLHVPWLVYAVRPLRALVVAWQWQINRFAFESADDEARTLSFRCGHFDWQTRRCDSYESRPLVCRDYPRFLLDQAWPTLFEECGYRAVSRNAAALSQALDKVALPGEVRDKLKKKLHVIE